MTAGGARGYSTDAITAPQVSTCHMTSVNCRDRTAEFFQVCEQKQKELTQPARPIVAKGKSQFMRDAGSIGNEIKSTSDKLQRLAKLAQRRSLFDDPADEINEMTAIIK